MTDPHDVPSTIGQVRPFAWSSDESVSYEAAIEAINGVVGAYSARIAAEEAKTNPDATLITAYEAGQAECALVRQQLDPSNHEQISKTRRDFTQLAIRIREGM